MDQKLSNIKFMPPLGCVLVNLIVLIICMGSPEYICCRDRFIKLHATQCEFLEFLHLNIGQRKNCFPGYDF